jgi:hypothetical protein
VATGYGELIVRKNIISYVSDPASLPSGVAMTGIELSNATNVVVENNIMNNTASPYNIRFTTCTTRKFFNNQSTAGQLLRGYDTAASLTVWELQDQVDDVLLPV